MNIFSLYKAFYRFIDNAYDSDDSDEVRKKKSLLIILSTGIAVFAVLLGSLYLVTGYPVSAAIPFSYALVSLCSVAYFLLLKRFDFFRFSQLLMILLLPFVLMWSLGGFANSSVVMIWAIFTPPAALYLYNLKAATIWLVIFFALTVLSGIFDPYLTKTVNPMDADLNAVFFTVNLIGVASLVFIIIHFFIKNQSASNQVAIKAIKDTGRSKKQLQTAILQIQKYEHEIRELMLVDPLTGIANRRYLEERILSEIQMVERYGRIFSIILIELDHRTHLNEKHGLSVSNSVLKGFCDTLKNQIRTTDFLAHYDGEKFVILMPEIDGKSAFVFAQRVRDTLESQPLHSDSNNVTASFGVTDVHERELMSEILKRADQALYQAKDLGRNRVVVADTKGILYQIDDLNTESVHGWKH